MVKGLLSIIICIALICGGSIIEQNAIRKDFATFDNILFTLQNKTEQHTAKGEDVLVAQKWWIRKKHTLHAYIPHNDIKEIDYWLAEAVSLVQSEDYDMALSKIEVLRELCEHIPGAFRINFENIF